ncbi:MAG: cation:proton antiporter [Bacteroidales bacterium]
MNHIEPLISDLALILLLAGGISLLFKWLKQPVMLGYILAGILAGSNFDFFPSVQEESSIAVWAEIGIIFLLFTLGLEFSFKKLIRVGSSVAIASTVLISGMTLLGYTTGKLLGWSDIDSFFLGCMLCFPSTIVIYKTFEDKGLLLKKFSTIVLGTLIVQDLFAILLMVLLPTFAIQRSIEGSVVGGSLFKMLFFLLVWFLVGIYLIPTMLRKFHKHLNNEVLLIVALALCFGMVVLANSVGLSSALGAFIMGSILAETIEAESIEKVTKPLKDLFGAVFFVSVGMMVKPEVLVEHFTPIISISLVVILGMIIIASSGILLSGQTLKRSIQAGFSLAMIGEFAFIIASLGQQLKVTSDFLYPIAVAVSIITTFTLPYLMRLAEPTFVAIESRLPERVRLFLFRYGSSNTAMNNRPLWHKYLRSYFKQVAIFTILLTGIYIGATRYVEPIIEIYFSGFYANLILLTTTMLLSTPLLWELSFRQANTDYFKELWDDSRFNHGKLIALQLLRITIAISFMAALFMHIYTFKIAFFLAAIVTTGVVILFFSPLRRALIHMEQIITFNLAVKENHGKKEFKNIALDLMTTHFTVSQSFPYSGIFLYKAKFREKFGVSIVSILRGDKRINIPGAKDQLFPFDIVTVVGTTPQLRAFGDIVEDKHSATKDNTDNFIHREVTLEQFVVEPCSNLWSKTIAESGISERFNSMLVAIEREGSQQAISITQDLKLIEGDLLWVVGDPKDLESLRREFCRRSYQEIE